MDQELERVINLFNAAQQKAVDILENEFRCPRPTSSDDFISRCVPVIRASGYEARGYKIRPHGIGLEINIDGLRVDFDFGPKGEFNGFDSWKLYEFVKNNRIKSTIKSNDQMMPLIEKEISEGCIKEYPGLGSVYYVNS